MEQVRIRSLAVNAMQCSQIMDIARVHVDWYPDLIRKVKKQVGPTCFHQPNSVTSDVQTSLSFHTQLHVLANDRFSFTTVSAR